MICVYNNFRKGKATSESGHTFKTWFLPLTSPRHRLQVLSCLQSFRVVGRVMYAKKDTELYAVKGWILHKQNKDQPSERETYHDQTSNSEDWVHDCLLGMIIPKDFKNLLSDRTARQSYKWLIGNTDSSEETREKCRPWYEGLQIWQLGVATTRGRQGTCQGHHNKSWLDWFIQTSCSSFFPDYRRHNYDRCRRS